MIRLSSFKRFIFKKKTKSKGQKPFLPPWAILGGVGLIIGGQLVDTYLTHQCIPQKGEVQVCFTPNQKCQKMLLSLVKQAKQSVYMHAFSFTDAELAQELIQAKRRGVKIAVLMDEGAAKDPRSVRLLLTRHKVSIKYDKVAGLAHNKIMIVDQRLVVTGSYNFSKAAYKRNADNILIVNDPEIAKQYLMNFKKRWR
jgi:phospholipase D